MLRSLISALTGLGQSQRNMDVIGNNVANVNTIGYKASRVSFSDAFNLTLRQPAPGSGNTTPTPPLQVGMGVTTSSIKNLFTQGALTQTNVPTDLAILGDGFFLVKDPVNGQVYVTRAGDFRLDENGYLVTSSGMRVQGYSDSALSSIGDIKIDTQGAPEGTDPNAVVANFTISPDGKINVILSDGTQFVRGQILMQRFTDPQMLVKIGENLYTNIQNAGPLSQPAAPGTNGLGTIQAGALELSNVDLSVEFTNLISAQRAFQANARVITTTDDVLQEVVNLKR